MPSALNREEREIWGKIEPALPDYAIGHGSPPWAYRLGLVGVVAGLLFAVAAYFGLILAIAVYVCVMGADPPDGTRFLPWLRYGATLSLAPLVLFFLVKPLFVQKRKGESLIRLEQGEHPMLDAFIARVARYADVPEPGVVYVDCSVNASTSYERGFTGMLGKRCRLVLGLPLVGGLNVRALGGVLAHEMGHFAQFHAMRLTYVIRRLNHWLYLVVHERDRWDAELSDMAFRRISIGTLIALPALAIISGLRGVLWLVMAAGHGLSCFALRQMEFGADRYEIAFAGHDGFWRTTKRISQLGAGFIEARRLINESWREHKLAADFSELARVQADDLSPEAVALAQQMIQKGQGVVFFTHPNDQARLRQARSHPWEEGVALAEFPASVLFRDYAGLCRRATEAFYKSEFGDKAVKNAIVGNPAIVKDGRRRRRERAAVEDFLGSLWRVLPRLHLVRQDLVGEVRGHSREELERRWIAERELSEGRIIAMQEARSRSREAVRGYERLMAGGRPDRASFGQAASDPWRMSSLVDERRREHEKSIVDLRHFLKSTRGRLVLGLQGAMGRGAFLTREVERLVRAMEFFSAIERDWLELESVLTAQRALVELLQKRRITSEALERLKFRAVQSEKVRSRIIGLADDVPDPLDRRGDSRSIGAVLAEWTSLAEDRGLRAYELAAGCHDALWGSYERVLGRLILLSSMR